MAETTLTGNQEDQRPFAKKVFDYVLNWAVGVLISTAKLLFEIWLEGMLLTKVVLLIALISWILLVTTELPYVRTIIAIGVTLPLAYLSIIVLGAKLVYEDAYPIRFAFSVFVLIIGSIVGIWYFYSDGLDWLWKFDAFIFAGSILTISVVDECFQNFRRDLPEFAFGELFRNVLEAIRFEFTTTEPETVLDDELEEEVLVGAQLSKPYSPIQESLQGSRENYRANLGQKKVEDTDVQDEAVIDEGEPEILLIALTEQEEKQKVILVAAGVLDSGEYDALTSEARAQMFLEFEYTKAEQERKAKEKREVEDSLAEAERLRLKKVANDVLLEKQRLAREAAKAKARQDKPALVKSSSNNGGDSKNSKPKKKQHSASSEISWTTSRVKSAVRQGMGSAEFKALFTLFKVLGNNSMKPVFGFEAKATKKTAKAAYTAIGKLISKNHKTKLSKLAELLNKKAIYLADQ